MSGYHDMMSRIHGGRKKILVDCEAAMCYINYPHSGMWYISHSNEMVKMRILGHEQMCTMDCIEWRQEGHQPSSSPLNCVVSKASSTSSEIRYVCDILA